MKKTLLLQTALVAAAGLFVADVANAQAKAVPLAVTVGGYFTQFFKVQDADTSPSSAATPAPGVDQNATALSSDAEIWFNIRGVLDNGTVIGGRVELEASTYADQIDERYLFIEKADVGRAEIGSTDRVTGKMLYFAPNSLPGHSTTVHSEYSATPNAPLMWFGNANHDTEGLNLYSASNRYLGSKVGKGLQVGLSWVPDGCQDFDAQAAGGSFANACGTAKFGSSVNAGQLSQQYAAAANYIESFGSVDAALYAGWNSVRREATSQGRMNGWQLGTTLTYNVGDGSTVILGGGYSDEDLTKAVGTVRGTDRKAYAIGLRYLTNGAAPGSIGIGGEYYKRKDSNTTGTGGVAAAAADTNDTKLTYYHLGLTYQLATGVLTFIGAGVSDLDVATNTSDNKQKFGVMGIGINF